MNVVDPSASTSIVFRTRDHPVLEVLDELVGKIRHLSTSQVPNESRFSIVDNIRQVVVGPDIITDSRKELHIIQFREEVTRKPTLSLTSFWIDIEIDRAIVCRAR